MQQVYEQKSPCNEFHEQIQYTTSSMNKIGFTGENINLQVSQREKSPWNKFHEQKISPQQVPRTKIRTQQYPWAK